MDPWPHQIRAENDIEAAILRGSRRSVLCARTGAGKSLIMCNCIEDWTAQGLKTILYTNRKALLEQLDETLTKHGIDFGVQAAGYDEGEAFAPVQLASMQTVHQRVTKKQKWGLFPADRVLVDEAHVQTGDMARSLLGAHYAAGAAIVGFTATPIELAELYDHLILAGSSQELRDCGALVLAHHYGPDEPDMRAVKGVKEGEELSAKQASSAMMRPGLFGRIWTWFEKLNPEHKPTICFGPDVAGSRWIAEQFVKRGVTAAHIDGEEVWVNGKTEKASRTSRADVFEQSKDGRLTVICNRFVLREGIDAPWLAHGIFATVFGSLQSYLQSGGRLLRAHPGIESVTIQDHGGNWWRHGSLNEDRAWDLGTSAHAAYALRADRLRKGERQPRLCPNCRRVLNSNKCRVEFGGCGWEGGDKARVVRAVVTSDGQMKELSGDVFKPRRVTARNDGKAIWKRMYFRALSKKWNATFSQAEATFARENNWGWPDRSWPLMPTKPRWMVCKVADVPTDELIDDPNDPELLGKVQAYREKNGRL